MDHDPYFDGRQPDNKSATSSGSPLASWAIVYGFNLIMPLMFATMLTHEAGKIGMAFAILLLFGLGCWAVSRIPSVGRAVIIGGGIVALTQFFPLLQGFAGAAGISAARDMGQTIDRDRLASELGGFAATVVTGGLLIILALVIGGMLQGVSALFGAIGSRRDACQEARRRGGRLVSADPAHPQASRLELALMIAFAVASILPVLAVLLGLAYQFVVAPLVRDHAHAAAFVIAGRTPPRPATPRLIGPAFAVDWTRRGDSAISQPRSPLERSTAMCEYSQNLSRRDAMRIGAAGVAAAGVAGLPPAATAADEPAGGKLPKRRYGRTGLEIGWLVGASDWPKELIPRAAAAGVNYWHKAQRWTADTLPPALKGQPRESYYLECVVDRVGGDHTHGRIDEEQHYQFVKDCLKASGVGYYDVFKFHFGYHSIDEAKTNPGMVRAFERLKKEGLVKHLAISQHHYNNIGGGMAWEILDYLAEAQPYDATQFFYTYNDRKEVAEWIDVAKKKDIATIAMKTMGGVGRAATDEKFKKLLADPKSQGSTPGAAMVKWLKSNDNLTGAVIATRNFDQFRENAGAAASVAMQPADHAALTLLAGYNKGLTCILCAQCVSQCPEHIAVADIFRYERYGRDYLDLDRARSEYKAMTKNGTSCLGCGDCLSSCPQEIDIPAKLRDVHRLLG